MLQQFFKICISVLCFLFSFSTFSCSSALPSNDPGFCQSFHVAAECYCVASGLPKKMCSNMNLLFQRMIGTLGSIENACRFQHNTSFQECVDDWNCYRFGGTNSQGELCSSTGAPCE